MTEGTKYHPLFEHLLFSGQGRMTMTFAEIEAILNARLPPSARQRAEWWSNSASGHSQARAWLRANYRAADIDLVNQRVSFKLDGWPDGYVASELSRHPEIGRAGFAEPSQASLENPAASEATGAMCDHPLFGIWAGKAKLLADYDYTRPAFERDTAS